MEWEKSLGERWVHRNPQEKPNIRVDPGAFQIPWITSASKGVDEL